MNTRHGITYIDPMNLSPVESRLLAFHLNSSQEPQLAKGVGYGCRFVDGSGESAKFYTIELTHRIVKRARSRDAQTFVYDIYGEKFEEGGQGIIWDLLATLHYQSLDSCLVSTQVQRIAKEERTTTERMQHEYKLAQLANQLSVKEPVFIIDRELAMSPLAGFFDQSPTGIMVMQRAPGVALNKLLDPNDKHYAGNLSAGDRLDLALAIAYAIQRYVHRHKITHCDIKEANIMVDLSKKPFGVTILDFGGGKLGDEIRSVAVTPFYCPPEFFKHKIFNMEGDFYSLGEVLSRVFGADEHPIKLKLQKKEEKEAKRASTGSKEDVKSLKRKLKSNQNL